MDKETMIAKLKRCAASTNRWYRVEDELPDSGTEIVMRFDGGWFLTGWRTFNDSWVVNNAEPNWIVIDEEPTHWMSIPELEENNNYEKEIIST